MPEDEQVGEASLVALRELLQLFEPQELGSAPHALAKVDDVRVVLETNVNGTFSYKPTSGFTGTDSFSYKANDGSADSNVVTVTLTVTNTARRGEDSGFELKFSLDKRSPLLTVFLLTGGSVPPVLDKA